ncbi:MULTISPECIES: urease accessory protein UreD [Streptomyces]|nr:MULTISPECIES: urease accessory protein UreD [Streptomyces]
MAADTRVVLEPGARLVLREEVLFGRYGEPCGGYRQRVRVETGQGPLYDQELATGPTAPGWDGPAVTAGRPAAGTLLVVDPAAAAGDGAADAFRAPDTALMELGGGARLLSALAPDTATLRHRLDDAAARLLTGTHEPAALRPAGV